MKKVMICLVGSALAAMGVLHAQDSTRLAQDTARVQTDTTGHVSGAQVVRLQDTTGKPMDTAKMQDSPVIKDTAKPMQDPPKVQEPVKASSDDAAQAKNSSKN